MDAKARKKGTVWNLVDSLQGDKVVWIIVLTLLLLSVVCLFSSTSRLLRGDTTRVDLMKEQLIFVGIGLALIIGIYSIRSTDFIRKAGLLGFPVSFLLLFLLDIHVRLPFLKAIELNGAYRILSIGGFQMHVFEVVKVAMVVYLASAIEAIKRGRIRKPATELHQKMLYLYAPFLITFIMLIPGSNSAALFIGGMMFLVILLGGGNLRDMSLLFLAGLVIVLLCFGIFKLSGGKYIKRIGTGVERIFGDGVDWEQKAIEARKGSKDYYDALDQIRQSYSAKIAIHEGGLVGKGPGQSTQRYVVPDISEDYMFSFILEEYGLFGGLLVIILYVSLLARGALIARHCKEDLFAKLAVAGLCLLISGQAFLHMCVNVEIGPMTGQTLPLISNGTSAFLCFCIAFGVILTISRKTSSTIEQEAREAAPLMRMHEVEAVDTRIDDLNDIDFDNPSNNGI